MNQMELELRLEEIKRQIKTYNAEGVYLFEGPIEKQLELRALTSEADEISDELDDLKCSKATKIDEEIINGPYDYDAQKDFDNQFK